MIDNTNKKALRNIFIWTICGIAGIVVFGTYIQAELTHRFYSKEIPGQELCPKKTNSLRYWKVIKYERYRKEAVMLCFYEERESNVEVTLNLTDKWNVVRTNRMFTKGGLYWPLYL
jgi:hypothetical protein